MTGLGAKRSFKLTHSPWAYRGMGVAAAGFIAIAVSRKL